MVQYLAVARRHHAADGGGRRLLNWPPAVALLLGAVLAPTDPLAGEVRVGEPLGTERDEDETRFALTARPG
ncbi:hypothetical protein GCM10027074_77260 [Streptomyces deserti]